MTGHSRPVIPRHDLFYGVQVAMAGSWDVVVIMNYVAAYVACLWYTKPVRSRCLAVPDEASVVHSK